MNTKRKWAIFTESHVKLVHTAIMLISRIRPGCCLVACCGSQVLIDLRDATEEYQKQTSNEEGEEDEEEQEPEESTFRETVL